MLIIHINLFILFYFVLHILLIIIIINKYLNHNNKIKYETKIEVSKKYILYATYSFNISMYLNIII